METVLLLLAFAIGTGFFSDLYSFCLGDPHEGQVTEGRVLSWLGRRLLDRFHRHEQRVLAQNEKRVSAFITDAREKWTFNNPGKPFVVPSSDRVKRIERYPVNWWKATGVCPRCFNVWLCFATFGALAWVCQFPTVWWLALIPYLGFSAMALSISSRARS